MPPARMSRGPAGGTEPAAAEAIPVPKMIAQPEPGRVHLYHPEIRADDEVGIETPSQ